MRWNVVIGGQLFSKSFLGYTTYKMEFATREGLLPALALMLLPFVLLWGLVKLLPPWTTVENQSGDDGGRLSRRFKVANSAVAAGAGGPPAQGSRT
jgi:hypothetical protein